MSIFAALLACALVSPAEEVADEALIDPEVDPVGSLLETNTLATAVLEKKNIFVETEGSIEVDFPSALRAIELDDLLGHIEDAWEVTEGEEVLFDILQEDEVTYTYTDRKNRPTKVIELGRFVTVNEDGEDQLDSIFHSSGKRFFGKFELLSHMTVIADPDQEGWTRYHTRVYVYPRNGFSRFFARHLGLVERFFKKETSNIEGYATRITQHIVKTMDATEEGSVGDTGGVPTSIPVE